MLQLHRLARGRLRACCSRAAGRLRVGDYCCRIPPASRIQALPSPHSLPKRSVVERLVVAARSAPLQGLRPLAEKAQAEGPDPAPHGRGCSDAPCTRDQTHKRTACAQWGIRWGHCSRRESGVPPRLPSLLPLPLPPPHQPRRRRSPPPLLVRHSPMASTNSLRQSSLMQRWIVHPACARQ